MAITKIATTDEGSQLPPKPSTASKIIHFIHTKKLGAFGAGIILTMVLMAICADFVSPYDPLENNYEKFLQAPNLENLLGTDRFGRDILSRIIHGSRTALFIGILSALIGATSGLILGLTSGYFGHTFDLLFMRIIDLFITGAVHIAHVIFTLPVTSKLP